MSWKRASVKMPMSMAGIIGISPNEQLEGIQIDPRTIVIASLIFVFAIKIADVIF